MAVHNMAIYIVVVCVAFMPNPASARCPHMDKFMAEAGSEQPATRTLLQSTLPPSYFEAATTLFARLRVATENCRMSATKMAYNNALNEVITGEGVAAPAPSWVRAFFHDCGTFVAKKSQGGPKGGCNGSLGNGCLTGTCGDVVAGAPKAIRTDSGTCIDGSGPVGNFDVPGSFCCPADFCVAKGQDQGVEAAAVDGKFGPVCLPGNSTVNELCRRENDGLLPTMQFYRKRQVEAVHKWLDPADGNTKVIPMADIIVMAAAAAVKECSKGALNLDVYVGRPQAPIADDVQLPSPNDVNDQTHFEIFQKMGLDKKAMVTLLTGSHTLGGFRSRVSPDLTDCPYLPFDCTPVGQFKDAPFDNNVFKVACDGVAGVVAPTCAFNQVCTQPSKDETKDNGLVPPGQCPFGEDLRTLYGACSHGKDTYPTPGLFSDKQLCQDPATMMTMVKYANDQAAFFTGYKDNYLKMATMGYDISTLKKLNV